MGESVHARNSEFDGIPTTSIPKLGIQCSRNSVQVAHGVPTRAHVPPYKTGLTFSFHIGVLSCMVGRGGKQDVSQYGACMAMW